jgi:hypothetical protein
VLNNRITIAACCHRRAAARLRFRSFGLYATGVNRVPVRGMSGK